MSPGTSMQAGKDDREQPGNGLYILSIWLSKGAEISCSSSHMDSRFWIPA